MGDHRLKIFFVLNFKNGYIVPSCGMIGLKRQYDGFCLRLALWAAQINMGWANENRKK